MNIEETKIRKLLKLQPKVFGDERGYFLESFKQEWWRDNLFNVEFVQDNESKSGYGVLRGLHFQRPPYEQSKLVRVIEGEVLDVAVDLREGSPTYGKHETVILSGENKTQFFVPRGFAHGFVVLSESAIFSYKVDNVYAPEHEGGIIWNDPKLGIDWNVSDENVKLSDKDKKLPPFESFKTPFHY